MSISLSITKSLIINVLFHIDFALSRHTSIILAWEMQLIGKQGIIILLRLMHLAIFSS